MKLSALLQPFVDQKYLLSEVDITGLQNDSRQIAGGELFFAYPGAVTDGRQYIDQAIRAGAKAVLYDSHECSINPEDNDHIPLIPITQLNDKLADIASRFYGYPSTRLSITGVTGTNGKTTIAYQLAQAYVLLGHRAAYVGTLGQGEVHALHPLSNTTPDALCMQKLLHEYVEAGIQHVCMEVSSHALSLGRVEHIDFTQAIYTNLSLDHLDFHGSMEAYAVAKSSLFSKSTLKVGIINQDDNESQRMKRQLPSLCHSFTYGLHDTADVYAHHWHTVQSGTLLEVNSPWGHHTLQLKSLGRFNVYNSLAVFASLMASGIASADAIQKVMSDLNPSPGRMEIVAQNPCVIVDFAHTPDALENVLSTVKALNPQKLWVVFGCGGDRDSTKRPVMGAIASQYADVVVVTSDNPRTEDPDTIIHDILKGMSESAATLKVIIDRRAAIHDALNNASADDIVLIAGKGHEDYQIIGHQRLPFSDQQVVSDFLKAR